MAQEAIDVCLRVLKENNKSRFDTYVQKCMQWRKWRKIASLWQFELDAKSGPLETGDFGEIGDFGKNRQRASDNDGKRPGPLETGDREQSIDHIPYYLSG